MNKSNRHAVSLGIAAVIIGFFWAIVQIALLPAARADESQLDMEAREISDSLMSPFCPGLTVSACTSGEAEALRKKIREDLSAGVSAEKIKSELVSKYGEDMLGSPSSEGFGKLAWMAPVVFVILGLVIVPICLRNMSASNSGERKVQ